MKTHEFTPAQARHFHHLSQWVIDKFGKYSGFMDYQSAFNDHFTNYQEDIQKKLDLNSLENGLISCAPAALITGIWWQLEHEYEAHFLMRNLNSAGDPLARRHVFLALPTIRFLSKQDLARSLDDSRDVDSPLVTDFIYEKKFGDQEGSYALVETPKIRIPKKFRMITGAQKFATERYNLFNYHPADPSPPVEPFSSPSTHSVPNGQLQK